LGSAELYHISNQRRKKTRIAQHKTYVGGAKGGEELLIVKETPSAAKPGVL